MNILKTCPVTIVAKEGSNVLQHTFSSLFACGSRSEIEEAARSIAQHQEQALKITGFPEVEGTYSRTILARGENGFEAMIARWSPGYSTVVHGHPDYALYLLVHGRLGVEEFTLKNGSPSLENCHEMSPGEHFVREGEPDKYDNAIHRITVLEESLSLHVYSDDALKGCCFQDYAQTSPFLQ